MLHLETLLQKGHNDVQGCCGLPHLFVCKVVHKFISNVGVTNSSIYTFVDLKTQDSATFPVERNL